MIAWDSAVERSTLRLVQGMCAPGRPPAERDRTWQALLRVIAPHLEQWIAKATLLRRVGLATEDDVRTVLVDVIERLHDKDCRNLRDFLASEPVDPDELEELGLIGELAVVAAAPDDDEPPPPSAPTPLRAWLLTLCRFVAKDHVKRRFGWTSLSRTQLPTVGEDPESRADLEVAVRALAGVVDLRWDGPILVVMHRPGALAAEALRRAVTERGWQLGHGSALRNKRDLYTGADRLDAQRDAGVRPPITDLLTARAVVAEIREYMATLPSDMSRALELWMTDATFEEIAETIQIAVPSARALVRAGQARLRDKFRPALPALF